MRKYLWIIVAMLASSPAFASTPKPPCLDPIIKASAPYGEGKLNKLFLKVYEASLWTDARDWSMDSVFALSINYNLDFDNDELADRSIDEMQHVSPVPADKLTFYKEELTRAFPNVKKGDNITALYDPHKGVVFYFNNKMYSHIKDQDLAKRFLSIWFAPNTSEPTLRASLLGAHSG